MYQPTHKEYDCTNAKQIMSFLTKDNLDLFIVDFRIMLEGALEFKELVLAEAKKHGVPVDQNVIDYLHDLRLTWIDDGKHEYENKSLIPFDL